MPTTVERFTDEFEFLYYSDITVTEYYNCFTELAQYCMEGNVDAPTLISNFMIKLRQSIVNKIAEHRFNSSIDCYDSVQLTEANIECRNVVCA